MFSSAVASAKERCERFRRRCCCCCCCLRPCLKCFSCFRWCCVSLSCRVWRPIRYLLTVAIRLTIKLWTSRLFLCTLFSIVLVFFVSRYIPFTIFHHVTLWDDLTGSMAYEQAGYLLASQNAARVRFANQYLTSYKNDKTKFQKLNELIRPGPDKDLLITVVTVDRLIDLGFNGPPIRPRYFTQTAARLLQELEIYYDGSRKEDFLNGEERKKLNIELVFCSVDVLPSINLEVNFVKNASSIAILERFNHEHPARPGYMQLVNTYEREKQDYVFCLNNSFHMNAHQGRNPRYVLTIEDDAPPIDNYFFYLEDLIRNKLDRNNYGHEGEDRISQSSRNEDDKRRDSIYFVKMFHPESLLEFHSLAAERLPQLFAVAFFLTCATLLGYAFCFGRRSNLEAVFSRAPFLKVMIYFLVMSLVIGRPNTVFHYQHFLAKYFGWTTVVPTPSCCTQALLFPDSSIPMTTTFMANAACEDNYAKDAVIDKLREALQPSRQAWLIQPNLHHHVGLFSIVRRQINSNYRLFLGIN